jgi:hypothetical protein
MTKATGTFTVTLTPTDTHKPMSAPAQFGRMTLAKKFEGALNATSIGEMLSVRIAETASAGYVAIEQVTGTLEGKTGDFVLQHFGTMTQHNSMLNLQIIPDSGTGELAGIEGTMTIDMVEDQHAYELTYRLV